MGRILVLMSNNLFLTWIALGFITALYAAAFRPQFWVKTDRNGKEGIGPFGLFILIVFFFPITWLGAILGTCRSINRRFAGQWKCKLCNQKNKQDDKECLICGTAREWRPAAATRKVEFLDREIDAISDDINVSNQKDTEQ